MRKIAFRVSLFIIALVAPFYVAAEIIDIKSMREVENHLQDGSLVIFDLDNTIFEPKQELGNDQWFRQRIMDYRDRGLEKEIAVEKALVEWIGVQGVTEMRLVEDHSLPLISNLQENGHHVMGLTTRGMEVSVQTLHHLQNLGVHFHPTAPHDKEHVFMNGKRGVLFKKGVLFTSGTHKGNALLELLSHAKVAPEHVIFINDKYDNLKEIADVCYAKEIPFIGLRYGYLDEKVESYDHSVAIKQFEHFGKILTDDHAKNLLKK